jgi:hypothetical protein
VHLGCWGIHRFGTFTVVFADFGDLRLKRLPGGLGSHMMATGTVCRLSCLLSSKNRYGLKLSGKSVQALAIGLGVLSLLRISGLSWISLRSCAWLRDTSTVFLTFVWGSQMTECIRHLSPPALLFSWFRCGELCMVWPILAVLKCLASHSIERRSLYGVSWRFVETKPWCLLSFTTKLKVQ